MPNFASRVSYMCHLTGDHEETFEFRSSIWQPLIDGKKVWRRQLIGIKTKVGSDELKEWFIAGWQFLLLRQRAVNTALGFVPILSNGQIGDPHPALLYWYMVNNQSMGSHSRKGDVLAIDWLRNSLQYLVYPNQLMDLS